MLSNDCVTRRAGHLMPAQPCLCRSSSQETRADRKLKSDRAKAETIGDRDERAMKVAAASDRQAEPDADAPQSPRSAGDGNIAHAGADSSASEDSWGRR